MDNKGISGGRYTMVAIAYVKSKPVAIQYNEYTTNNSGNREWHVWHAESKLIRQVDPTKDITIYIAGVSKGGNITSSKPCINCNRFIQQYAFNRKITVVYFDKPANQLKTIIYKNRG